MKGLLVKDYLMLINQKRFLLLALVMMVVISLSGSGATFAIGYCAFMGVLNGVSTISYDEYNHGYSFLLTLPFTRKEYVLEKYLFTFLCVTLFSLVGGFIAFGSQLVQASPAFSLFELAISLVTLLCMSLLVAAIMLPVQLRFGSEKGRIAFVVVMLSLFVVVIGGVQLAEVLNWQLENLLRQLSLPLFGVALIAIVILSLLISYGLSLHIMRKKEF